jgi:UPF0271 protein
VTDNRQVKRIDLNADLGEECGDDAAMLRLVSSASLACGGHAGGGEVLQETARLAARSGVGIGAHPSYRDREQFGRVSRFGDIGPAALARDLVEQIALVGRAAAAHDKSISHIKPHGALYHDVAHRHELIEMLLLAASEVADMAVKEGWPLSRGPFPILGLPGSLLEGRTVSSGGVFFREAFADRGYLPDGNLVPRSQPGAVLDAEAATRQAVQIAASGTVTCADGSIIPMPADSICLHGDTPGAVKMAARVRSALEGEGVVITPLAKVR